MIGEDLNALMHYYDTHKNQVSTEEYLFDGAQTTCWRKWKPVQLLGQGRSGSRVYLVCKDDECDYVARITPSSQVVTQSNIDNDMKGEAVLYQAASDINVGPKVEDIIECSVNDIPFQILVIEKFDGNLYDLLYEHENLSDDMLQQIFTDSFSNLYRLNTETKIQHLEPTICNFLYKRDRNGGLKIRLSDYRMSEPSSSIKEDADMGNQILLFVIFLKFKLHLSVGKF